MKACFADKYLKTRPVYIYYVSILITILISNALDAQPLLLMDRMNNNKIVNDSTITIYSSDLLTSELTAYFTMKNNSDKPLAVFLKKHVNYISDSTMDYYCFHIKCWPGSDSTDVADTIQPGAEDYTFASHVCHVRRFENPPLLPGITSITYTVYDYSSLPEPMEARVTVNYHLSGVGMIEKQTNDPNAFPNPADQYVLLKSGTVPEGDCILTIAKSDGTLVIKKNLPFSERKILLDTSDLPDGLFFLTALLENGVQHSYKVLIKH